MKRALLLVGVLAVVVAAGAMRACPREPRLPPDLRSTDAAEGLRAEPGFTTRQRSAIGRQLVQIVAVRRIGRASCEVEFTWKDTAPPAGQSEAPLRTSMGLFRFQEDGRWRLTSLFRVD